MNVGAKIKLTWQDAVPAPMPCQERDFPPLKRATNVWIRRHAKRRLHAYLPDLAQSGHRIKPAAADYSNLRLCHPSSRSFASRTRDYTRRSVQPCDPMVALVRRVQLYNSRMRVSSALIFVFLIFVFLNSAYAQDATKPAPQAEPKSVTVPITLDHNRIVIDVYLPLPDGSTKRIRGWVDSGNPDLEMSRRAATLMGLNVTCDDKACSAPPPREITIGGMKIPLVAVKEAKIPLKPVTAASVMATGMSAEINLPSTVLRNYDVLVSFPDREFTMGQRGTIHFRGMSGKILVNAETGLVQMPSKIDGKSYNLGLDVGSSFSFLTSEVFDKLASAHSDWPHMTGAVGNANMWGLDGEPKLKLLRVDRVQYSPVFLTGVATASLPASESTFFEKRAGASTAGLLGSNALLNYRVGIDYAHSMAYFEVGTTFKAPDFDVIGLTLRPEDDGRFTILGVADFDGKPSVPEVQVGDHLFAVDGIPVPESTMGQVWSMLEGQPRQERKLTIERAGKQITVVGKVQHFLGEQPEKDTTKGKPERHYR